MHEFWSDDVVKTNTDHVTTKTENNSRSDCAVTRIPCRNRKFKQIKIQCFKIINEEPFLRWKMHTPPPIAQESQITPTIAIANPRIRPFQQSTTCPHRTNLQLLSSEIHCRNRCHSRNPPTIHPHPSNPVSHKNPSHKASTIESAPTPSRSNRPQNRHSIKPSRSGQIPSAHHVVVFPPDWPCSWQAHRASACLRHLRRLRHPDRRLRLSCATVASSTQAGSQSGCSALIEQERLRASKLCTLLGCIRLSAPPKKSICAGKKARGTQKLCPVVSDVRGEEGSVDGSADMDRRRGWPYCRLPIRSVGTESPSSFGLCSFVLCVVASNRSL